MASHSVQGAYDEILKSKYPAKAHFKRVVAYLKSQHASTYTDSGVIFLESAKSRLWPNCDQEAPLRQDRYFYYLTGCELPDCYIIYDVAKSKSTLFIPPVVPEEVIWSGLPLSTKEALAKYDVDDVKTSNEVNAFLNGPETSKKTVWAMEKFVSDHITFLSFDKKDMTHLKEAVEESRVVKDEYEIALTRKACAISGVAHRAVMKAAKHASNERELAGVFVDRCIANGCPNQAYSPIVAAGTDAATLHYLNNNKPITSSTLNLLLDASGEYNCYASDITRTFPINGKFTKESADIYSVVLYMQKTCMSKLKAGVLWDEIHALAHKTAIEGLLKLGILKGNAADIAQAKTSTAFFPHGLGHYLGMDTHDTGGHPNYTDSDPMFRYLRVRGSLPAGSIITVEPGVYFCRFIIEPYLKNPEQAKFIDKDVLDRYWQVGGVRIEDDVLITENGFDNLTNVPKELAEIEALMA